MEAIISALGLILSALMDIPARTVAASEAKKPRIGKTIAELITLLDKIVLRGLTILNKLEVLAEIDDSNFPDAAEALDVLINDQIQDLTSLTHIIRERFLWGDTFGDISDFDSYTFQMRQTQVQKVLSVYEPDLGRVLGFIIDEKGSLLTELSKLLRESMSGLEKDKLVLKELVSFDPDLFEHFYMVPGSRSIFEYAEEVGKAKYHEYDLKNPNERSVYLGRARRRLMELQSARDKLTEIVQKYYEPHHLL